MVNDLDLIVTNLDTGEVFYGNDISAGNSFSLPWDTNGPPNIDAVNNVENVYLASGLGASYSVTVSGHRVNVNAVTAHTNGVVQDYALVISSGDGQVADALTVADAPVVSALVPLVTLITNSFSASPSDVGGILFNQRVGANSPLLDSNTVLLPGATNTLLTIGSPGQWHFYIFTNDTSFTNAAFLTFLPRALSLTPGDAASLSGSGLREADIDLYVSMDAGLTNLDPVAISNAWMSVSRGGAETVVLTNALPGAYYLGVKSETQEAAEYGVLGVFSELPFAETDALGNQLLRGFPAPALIPEGSAAQPGTASIFCIAPDPVAVRRVVVTNTITHPSMGDLLGTLSHGSISAVLNNHSPGMAVTNQAFVYDDSDEADFPGAQHTDGPGSLARFHGPAGLRSMGAYHGQHQLGRDGRWPPDFARAAA